MSLFIQALLLVLSLGLTSQHPAIAEESAASETVHQPHVSARLLSEQEVLGRGLRETFALELTPDPEWHLYWRYAGDSGAAPKLHWEVEGASLAADTLWPTPERIAVGPFVNYGYTSQTLLLTELPIPDDAPGEITIRLDAEWLVCQEECIPGNGEFQLTLPVDDGSSSQPSSHSAKITTAQQQLPSAEDSLELSVLAESEETVVVSFPLAKSPATQPFFYPAHPGIIENAAPQQFTRSGTTGTLTLQKSKGLRHTGPREGLLVIRGESTTESYAVTVPTQPNEAIPEETSSKDTPHSLLNILFLAFLGGIILNLMPCVFPVLSIKILSFLEKSGKQSHQVRRHGLSFAAGILVSFWILALSIRGLREAGEQLGWGFQLQNPAFVACLILLLVAVALNLFGVFEFGSSIQRLSGSLDRDGESYTHSFLSGILATLLATPCTAPFMGGAVAYGIQASLLPSLAVFTALALGLATPYVVLTFFPRLLTALPRPGVWMETFKELMGFPVLLTALWLLWVYEKQSSSQQLLALLLALLTVSFACWGYGKIAPLCASRKRQRIGMLFFITLTALSLWICIPRTEKALEQHTSSSTTSQNHPSEGEKDSHGLLWLTFSPTTVETLLNEGRPVYIDFTAAWCITCQVNKRVIFGSEELREEFRERNVALVRGDWTNEDPLITAELEKFERLGVPLNVLYDPKYPSEPTVFPSVLTPQIVREALEKL
ncbi:thioredoxin family protein [bacterium]|nr:thioredoxin family protein [bacterium]